MELLRLSSRSLSCWRNSTRCCAAGAMSSAVATAAAMVMRALLLGLSPLNLRASGPAIAVLVLVTVLVSTAAVVRALRIDPARALREE